MPIRFCLTLLAATALLSKGTTQAETAQQEQQRRVLQRHGLSFERKAWILDEESLLRRDLERLDQLERQFYSANEQFTVVTRAFLTSRQRKKEADEARETLNGQLARPDITPLAQQQIGQQIKRINNQIQPTVRALRGDLNIDSDTSVLTQSIRTYIEGQNSLGLALLAIRRRLEFIEQRYESLSTNDQVQVALGSAGKQGRLGPLESRYQGRLKRLEQAALGKHVAMFRHGGQYRIPAILDEAAPLTLGHTGSKGHLLLTNSVLQAAGIDVPNAAQGETFKHDEHRYTIRAVTIPHLRFGRVVLTDVAAWALPPEAEHIGCRISDEALPGAGAALDEEQMRFSVRGD